MTSDRRKWAKVLKQVPWNKPTFSEGYLVTKLNLDKKDENSFYYKDELPCLYSEWLTSIRPGVLLGKMVNPVEFISPVVVEKIGNQWKVNKEETDKAIDLLSDKGLVAIHCSREENEPVYILSESLCENKAFLEGQLIIPKDWPNQLPDLKSFLNQVFYFYVTEDAVFQEFSSHYPEQAEAIKNYFGEIELASSKALRKNSVTWDNLTYSYTPESSDNSTRTFTKRSSLSPKEKLAVLVELLESEEMEKLATLLDSKGVVLNQRNRFVLATELVLGFGSTIIVEDKQ